jgi:hypothetical protein
MRVLIEPLLQTLVVGREAVSDCESVLGLQINRVSD